MMATVPPGCEKSRRYDIIILTIGVANIITEVQMGRFKPKWMFFTVWAV